MRILILGATGRLGRLIVEKALAKGYRVNVLVRSAGKVPFETFYENLELFEGNPTNRANLNRAIEGCNHVISALNVSRKSDFPWSSLRAPATLLSDTMSHLVDIAFQHRIKKLVICSAWGVSTTRNDLPFWFKWLIEHSNIKPAYDDHERQERILQESDLKWTIVRPVGLTNGKNRQAILESLNNTPKPGLTINRNTVAEYMINAISNAKLDCTCPVISTK
ncbi:MAG: NAD(P)H-binding protein [Bacteroidota bacterium]